MLCFWDEQTPTGYTSQTYRYSSRLTPSKSPSGREVSPLLSKRLSNTTEAQRKDNISSSLGVAAQLPGLVAHRDTVLRGRRTSMLGARNNVSLQRWGEPKTHRAHQPNSQHIQLTEPAEKTLW